MSFFFNPNLTQKLFRSTRVQVKSNFDTPTSCLFLFYRISIYRTKWFDFSWYNNESNKYKRNWLYLNYLVVNSYIECSSILFIYFVVHQDIYTIIKYIQINISVRIVSVWHDTEKHISIYSVWHKYVNYYNFLSIAYLFLVYSYSFLLIWF